MQYAEAHDKGSFCRFLDVSIANYLFLELQSLVFDSAQTSLDGDHGSNSWCDRTNRLSLLERIYLMSRFVSNSIHLIFCHVFLIGASVGLAESFDSFPAGSQVRFLQPATVNATSSFQFHEQGKSVCDVFVAKAIDQSNIELNSTDSWTVKDTLVARGGPYRLKPGTVWYRLKSELTHLDSNPDISLWSKINFANASLEHSMRTAFTSAHQKIAPNKFFFNAHGEVDDIVSMETSVRLLLLEQSQAGNMVNVVVGCTSKHGWERFSLNSASKIELVDGKFVYHNLMQVTVPLPNWTDPSVEDVDSIIEISP